MSDLKEEIILPIFYRSLVDFANGAKGKTQILLPQEAHAIKSKQRRHMGSPSPQPPTVQFLLKDAYRYQKILEEHPGMSRAALARTEDISPTLLTGILNLLKLAPEIQREILQLGPTIYQTPINQRRLHPITQISDHQAQMRAFNRLKNLKPRARLQLKPPEPNFVGAIGEL